MVTAHCFLMVYLSTKKKRSLFRIERLRWMVYGQHMHTSKYYCICQLIYFRLRRQRCRFFDLRSKTKQWKIVLSSLMLLQVRTLSLKLNKIVNDTDNISKTKSRQRTNVCQKDWRVNCIHNTQHTLLVHSFDSVKWMRKKTATESSTSYKLMWI